MPRKKSGSLLRRDTPEPERNPGSREMLRTAESCTLERRQQKSRRFQGIGRLLRHCPQESTLPLLLKAGRQRLRQGVEQRQRSGRGCGKSGQQSCRKGAVCQKAEGIQKCRETSSGWCVCCVDGEPGKRSGSGRTGCRSAFRQHQLLFPLAAEARYQAAVYRCMKIRNGGDRKCSFSDFPLSVWKIFGIRNGIQGTAGHRSKYSEVYRRASGDAGDMRHSGADFPADHQLVFLVLHDWRILSGTYTAEDADIRGHKQRLSGNGGGPADRDRPCEDYASRL